MIDRTDGRWYKQAIIYEVHVRSFFDADDDGVGDFIGMTQKLDYLQDLGVTALWLLPFYPSPLKDDGYDISQYRAINPSFGSMRDFRSFVRACHDRGIRVITELVVNHTSDQHPWFQRARHAKPGSTWRDFYVWSENDHRYSDARIIFLDTEKSNWTWDPVAQAYYWHRFYSHQPDLNFDNPRVLEQIMKAMHFWMEAEVDGMRLDAIPYLVEREGTNCENLEETHAIVRKIRAEIDAHYPDRMLLGEANQWPEDAAAYFGDGDECHMCYHFPLMPRMYMAIALEDRHPITDILRQTPEIPQACQWATFLRNHDELTLEMVTDRERDYLWRSYAADPSMRINLGIRRRLAPLLDNDRSKIELMNSLLFSLPGTPIVYYGDEIGMGDNVYLGDRNSVRTPMQWSPTRNGGFSNCDPQRLYLPLVMDPIYGYEAVNVEAQRRSASSLLNWMRRIIAVRKQHPAFAFGSLRFLLPGNRKILTYLRESGDDAILCVANLSRSAQAVEIDLSQFKGRVPIEMMGHSPFPPIGDLPYLLTLPGFGYYWFMLADRASAPDWHETVVETLPEYVTLVARTTWESVLVGREAQELQRNVLPEFLESQSWFSAKDTSIAAVSLDQLGSLADERSHFALTRANVTYASGAEQSYFLPLALTWDEDDLAPGKPLAAIAIAKVRRGSQVGVLCDGQGSDELILALLRKMRERAKIDSDSGTTSFLGSEALDQLGFADETALRRFGEQSNSSVIVIAEQAILKIFRRLTPGERPEVEMARYLTEQAHFGNVPELLGVIEHSDRSGELCTLAMLSEFVRNQGDAWTFACAYLDRHFDELLSVEPVEELSPSERHAIYLEQIRTLARRVAELHLALGAKCDNRDFAPEPIKRVDLNGWSDAAHRKLDNAFALLERSRPILDPAIQELADKCLGRYVECLAVLDQARDLDPKTDKTRIHGDLHLGQVLIAQDDVYFIDFEGNAGLSAAERRAKVSPLKDIARMLRSLDRAVRLSLLRATEHKGNPAAILEGPAMAFRDFAGTAFLNDYVERAGASRLWPADSNVARKLLDFFLMDWILDEIEVGSVNESDWLRISLSGLLALLDELAAREGAA